MNIHFQTEKLVRLPGKH